MSSFNIYVLDVDPVLAVQALCDRHLSAAATCAAQMLRTADVLLRRERCVADKVPRSEWPTLKGLVHPRHPITRNAARSPTYAEWVGRYGFAAMREQEYRGIVSGVDVWAELEQVIVDLRQRRPFEVAEAELYPPHPSSLVRFPQRLDGAQDLEVDGDPVAAYRRWYALTKPTGAPRAWRWAEVVYTRRPPPTWLVEPDAPYSCVAEELVDLGLDDCPHTRWSVSVDAASATR